MQIPFKQTTKSGCVSFSLANLFYDSRYITDVETIDQGETLAGANKKLWQFHPDFFVESYFVTHSEMTKQPNRLIDDLPFHTYFDKVAPDFKEHYARPYLVTFRRDTGIHHCIAVLLNLKNNRLYILDSKCEEVNTMAIQEFIDWYHIITVEYFGMWSLNDIQSTMHLRKDSLTHIFNPGE